MGYSGIVASSFEMPHGNLTATIRLVARPVKERTHQNELRQASRKSLCGVNDDHSTHGELVTDTIHLCTDDSKSLFFGLIDLHNNNRLIDVHRTQGRTSRRLHTNCPSATTSATLNIKSKWVLKYQR